MIGVKFYDDELDAFRLLARTFSNSRGHRMISFPDDQEHYGSTISDFQNALEDEEEGRGRERRQYRCARQGDEGESEIRVVEFPVVQVLRELRWQRVPDQGGSMSSNVRISQNPDVIEHSNSASRNMLHNTTEPIDNNLCVDAGLDMPKPRRKCGFDECPQWTVYEWSPCERSKCFSWHKGVVLMGCNHPHSIFDRGFVISDPENPRDDFRAMQRRIVRCEILANLTVDNSKCDPDENPPEKQECYNEKCVGKWRVGAWSELIDHNSFYLKMVRHLSEREIIEILIMIGYGDRARTQFEVCRLFNNKYPNKEPTTESTVLPTRQDYFLWGYLKNKVYFNRPNTIEELKDNSQ
ncbi:hypothetical protein NQ318_018699 [Aromia moschata]|uniref:Uncharacterized protein n=1 Tax=Aromia moschata TaxID=1265417 RepID=A0AAV8ZG05_9CUCU|nr:hypothetical protein NQ318_018699 [Aromia moschata]